MKTGSMESAAASPAGNAGERGQGERALILHTQRLSTEDGPGIRTSVFFKGCPLRCGWCHNPESISPKRQLHWMESRCIGCGICLKACPHGRLEKNSSGIVRDRVACQLCGKCAEDCPAGAQEILGKEVGTDDLLAELLKDKVYYDKSGGGITLSGGEPMLQADFCAALLPRLKEAGISTAIDTCGLCAPAALEKCLPFTDLVLFDLKEIDPTMHRRWTGQDNRVILENLMQVRSFVEANPGTALWVRTPLIPGATADAETIQRIGSYIHDNLGGAVQRWELCAFNNLCRDKYRRLGMEWAFASTPLLTAQEMEKCQLIARASGPDPDRTFVTGAARTVN